MEKTDLAYLAGYFDADGSIVAGLSNPRYCNIRVCARIACRDVRLLDMLSNHYGGCMADNWTGPTYEAWVWTAMGKTAKMFLSDVQPYLRYKAEQCECALGIIETIGSAGVRVSPAVKLKRRRLALRICELNQSNLSVPTETKTMRDLKRLITEIEEYISEKNGG